MKDLIKQKRLELKESQSEFGKRFGLSHAAISDIERGVSTHVQLELIDFVLGRFKQSKLPEKIELGNNLKEIEAMQPVNSEERFAKNIAFGLLSLTNMVNQIIEYLEVKEKK